MRCAAAAESILSEVIRLVGKRSLVVLVLFALLLGAVSLPGATRAADPTQSAAPEGSVVLSDGTVLPPMPAAFDRPSIQAEMLGTVGAGRFTFAPGGAPTIVLSDGGGPKLLAAGTVAGIDSTATATTTALPNGLRKEVFGFLPYWMLSDTSSMNYQLISTIAYFSVGAGSDGNLLKGTSTGWSGWSSSQMTNVINQAHSRGVKVVMTVTMMAWDSASTSRMATFLGSTTYRARLVSQVAAAVKSRGADGVNLDFEPVPTSGRAQYTSFVRQMKAALLSAGAGSYLTVDVMGGAATWASGYDVTGLVASGAADRLFVMGYDYSWSGSARAGAVAPIDSPYVLDVNGSMTDFLTLVPGSKLIWGVPYYGRTWHTTSSALNAPSTGHSASFYYTGHLAQAATYGRLWDSVGKVPWYRYWSAAAGSWIEGYYDDVASLGYKYDLINQGGFAGTGMWTLLMDSGRDELWRLLANKFVNDTEPPAGGITVLPEISDALAIHASWKAVDYVSGVYNYNVQVRDWSSSSWSAWLSGTKVTSAYYIGTPGHTYEFRMQAVDLRGNAQPWSAAAPARPSGLLPAAFASVSTGVLNVRSGPGTSYGAVATLAAGDRVYVIRGPVSAGYAWYQVQYGFTEWPSSNYPLIGWVAAGDGTSSYLVPANAPSVTLLNPFIGSYMLSRTTFSPNADGSNDDVTLTYALRAATTDVRVDVVNTVGGLVDRWSVGAQPSGGHSVHWDGRTSAGAIAADGVYLVRLYATDGSGSIHAAPADGVAANVLTRWGVRVDTVAPRVSMAAPAAGAAMLPASTRPVAIFSEPLANVNSGSVRLINANGDGIPATLGWSSITHAVSVTPNSPLPTGQTVSLSFTSGISDLAGNRLVATSWKLGIAPGEAFAPSRTFVVRAGTHVAYRVGANGALIGKKSASLIRASSASSSQRADLPNLPGRWLYVQNGIWAGYWLPESAGAYLPGTLERVSYPSTAHLSFAAGAHVGYRFDASGRVTMTKSSILGRASGANVMARATINGAPYWLVVNGIWANYWIPESRVAYQPGFLGTTGLPGLPHITFAAGTYSGFSYDSSGRRTAAVTATLSHASGANVNAWSVINGVVHYRVSNGIWAGRWLPIDSRIGLG